MMSPKLRPTFTGTGVRFPPPVGVVRAMTELPLVVDQLVWASAVAVPQTVSG